jgi:hypothetical protein
MLAHSLYNKKIIARQNIVIIREQRTLGGRAADEFPAGKRFALRGLAPVRVRPVA